jgi:hypothetical protein
MKPNVGSTDRLIRVLAGIAMLAYAAFGPGATRLLGLIGLVPLLTALFSYCPLYALLGIKTCATTP